MGEGGGALAIQRTYRLALASDPSYAGYFASGVTPDAAVNAIVTAEKVTLMNRVDQLYGDDLSIRMLLVAGNDALNFNTTAQFIGAGGRCGPVACYTSDDSGCVTSTLATNRYVLGQVIGAESYDIGHIIFGGSGGGLAQIGGVGTSYKAGGCTGLPTPTGDGFAVDYVAHEMGHQFGGNHTFNGLSGTCGEGTAPNENRHAPTAVEPGSGSSVMGYAGICRQDDLQRHSDPYFSQRTQSEVAAFTSAAPASDPEVQNVALSGFGSGDSFTIGYGAGNLTTITSGAGYNAAAIRTAVEAAEPSNATAAVTGLWNGGPALTRGFQVTWSGSADIATPTLTKVSGSFSWLVGTTDNGGAQDKGGYANPAPSGNHNPVVTAPVPRTIPLRTPFQLTGSATDPDGDALVYLWEQDDTATNGTVLTSNTKPAGPLFRVFGSAAQVAGADAATYRSAGENAATSSPTRSFPDAAQVAAGSTNAATGACPSTSATSRLADGPTLECYSEFLPTTPRALSFRLTARDLGGADLGPDGGTAYDDVALTVGAAGPFAVTSQATAGTVVAGTTGTVAWDVAGTDTATYATAVRITFSTDGGLTFPTVLVPTTPNDGSQPITWPGVATARGRVRVEAVGNYFYDVNDAPITVTPTLTTGGTAAGATFAAASSDPLDAVPSITASSSSVDGTAITRSTLGLPTGLALTRTQSSAAGVRPGTTRFEVTGTAQVDPGSYPVEVRVADGVAPATTVAFAVEVGRDTAAVAYTGESAATTYDTGAGTGSVDVTVAATVEDTDPTPGTVAGSITFTDQTTGDALCTAPVVAGGASCTFGADVVGTERTYQVVGTLASTRYTGASAPAALVVTVLPPSLTTGGTAADATFEATSSDALDSTASITAQASSVDGAAITATPVGLPDGFTLDRVQSSADGVRPGTTRFEVTGTADADPGSYPVEVTVADGVAPDTTVELTIDVSADSATLSYTGDTFGTALETGADVLELTLSADVADTDATPGPVAGSVVFTDDTTGDDLCTAPVVAGEASCTFGADVAGTERAYQVVGTLDSARYTGATDPAALDVTVVGSATLTTGGDAAGATFPGVSSDPLGDPPVVTAEASAIDGDRITWSVSGLPAGLALARAQASTDGARPGTVELGLTGTVDDDPGTYDVVVTVSDGPGGAADETVAFAIEVGPDAATLTYTGDTAAIALESGTDVVAVTVSADVADTDATPGTVAGSVAFTDQATGEELCSAPVAAAAASCTFGADVADTERTYQVVATVGSARYTGASEPVALVVSVVPPTLTAGGNAVEGSFEAAYSDASDSTPAITAESSSADGGAITATPVGLPDGFTVTPVETSADGVRPGTTRFEVTGTADADPGSYPVELTLADGVAPEVTVAFTIDVVADAATVTYTGDTDATATRSGTDVVEVTVSADVADLDDSPGTVTGSVVFTDQSTGEELCTATIAAAAAACTFGADVADTERTYQVVATVGSARYLGASEPVALVVTVVPPTLTAGGNAGEGPFVAAYSDPLLSTPVITAASSLVDGGDISVSAAGLPGGLDVTAPVSSAPGVRPGTTRVEVTGTAQADPGSYRVVVTIADGVAPDATVAFTIDVVADSATVTYTGDTAADDVRERPGRGRRDGRRHGRGHRLHARDRHRRHPLQRRRHRRRALHGAARLRQSDRRLDGQSERHGLLHVRGGRGGCRATLRGRRHPGERPRTPAPRSPSTWPSPAWTTSPPRPGSPVVRGPMPTSWDSRSCCATRPSPERRTPARSGPSTGSAPRPASCGSRSRGRGPTSSGWPPPTARATATPARPADASSCRPTTATSRRARGRGSAEATPGAIGRPTPSSPARAPR